jgi:ketosteroid isomerase-like protein
MSSIRSIVLAGASLLLITACSARPVTSAASSGMGAGGADMADSIGAHRAAVGFLAAFDSLQWEEFRAYLSDEVTMFFPFPQFAGRADGRVAVEEVFRQFFDAQRTARTEAGRPLIQGLAPRDLRVQMAGPAAAVVSFHLGAESSPARRSLVLRRTASGEWKIIHWHASSVPQPAPR